jgi:hypothetical protein
MGGDSREADRSKQILLAFSCLETFQLFCFEFWSFVFVSCFGLPWRDGYYLVFDFVKVRMYVAQNELLIIQVWARDFEFRIF